MIDEMIASGLAALARENQQRIPAFVPPPRRSRAVSHVFTRAHLLAVGPTITMLLLGGVLLALDRAPFGSYEPYVMPLGVAVASLAGLVIARARKPLPVAVLRARLAWCLVGSALLTGAALYLVHGWPGHATAMSAHVTPEAVYACSVFDGNGLVQGAGFIVIAATLAVWIGRRIAARAKPAWLADRRDLEAWSTTALIIGVLVVVVWANAFDFDHRGWMLASFRLPDPAFHKNLVAYTTANMWFALTYRPLSQSAVTPAQWDLFAAALLVASVALVTGIAIARERGHARRSRWLRLLELPAVVPLFVILAAGNLARATVVDYPPDAGRPFAWMVVCVMLAFTSMVLRRRRRDRSD